MARFILHETIINASVDEVWNELIAIEDWKWNRWTKLKADNPTEGVKGKLLASFEGDGTWKEYDFTFGRVSESEHLLTWVAVLGPRIACFLVITRCSSRKWMIAGRN